MSAEKLNDEELLITLIIHRDGTQEWRANGKRHRDDGPAYIGADGNSWWIRGNKHRYDGPAIIWTGGKEEWYINEVNVTDRAIAWIEENNFPDYTLWTDTQKLMFRLAFSGISA